MEWQTEVLKSNKVSNLRIIKIIFAGSHGDGDKYETETPIVAWGAGVAKYTESMKNADKLFSNIGSTTVPRFDIKQIDIAPLMSTLLGIPVPVNSYGQLPHQYLNTSKVSIVYLSYWGW